ncbi:MAG TPA: glycosyltransferase family 4 protein [Solirubrobacterales bacterium]|nr:glycosyltransferase family 4 protein [Solirubrobacterales bacterium]
MTATFPPYPGGAGNTCFQFARRQAERGDHVEVFTAPATGEVPDSGAAIVHRIPPLVAIGNAPLIPRLARLTAFDVLHLHYPFIFGAELVLAGRLRPVAREAALLVHYKNRLVGDGARGALFGAYEHTVSPLLIRAADRICVLSRDHAESVPYLRRALEADPARLVEMPNGVDVDVFSPGPDADGVRQRLGIPDDAVVAAFVATLDRAHHFKRLDVAIEAIARADDRLHLIVAGGGDLLDGFRDRARAADVAARVHFLGSVPHAGLPGVLRAADLILLTTEPPESFGIVLIEAMACGLPAVATEYPGVRAVIEPGINGVLAPPSDAAAVAAALRSVAELGAEGRRRLGEAGREKAVREWSWPRLVNRMEGAYREAIERRRGAAPS